MSIENILRYQYKVEVFNRQTSQRFCTIDKDHVLTNIKILMDHFEFDEVPKQQVTNGICKLLENMSEEDIIGVPFTYRYLQGTVIFMIERNPK